jgi:hypothetical protein
MARLRQLEPHKVTVGEYNFYIKPFPAFTTANLTGELASMLTPILAAHLPLVGGDNEGEEDGEDNGLMDVDVDKAAESISHCMDGFSGKKVETLLKKLLVAYRNIFVELPVEDEDDMATGEYEQEVLDMDLANELFCGEVQDMFVLAFHVIKLNFNGFFKKLGGQYGKVAGALVKKTRTIL